MIWKKRDVVSYNAGPQTVFHFELKGNKTTPYKPLFLLRPSLKSQRIDQRRD